MKEASSRGEIHNERVIRIDERGRANLAWPSERTIWYATGREALTGLVHALGLTSDDAALLPTFVPEGVIAPFKRAGIQVHQYSLTHGLEPDWDHLEQLLHRHSPRLAVLIHYFGIPQDVARFSLACHTAGASVVEDRAHLLHDGVLTNWEPGDFVLYSLPKLVGVPDAAPLVVHSADVMLSDFRFARRARHAWYAAAEIYRLWVNSIARRSTARAWMLRIARLGVRGLAAYRLLMTYFQNPTRASRLSRRLLERIDWRTEIEQRRSHEKRYRDGLDPRVFRPWRAGTADGTCGMGYPVYVDDRDAFEAFLRSERIFGVSFEARWDYFDRHSRENAAALAAMKEHFLFPTSRGLSEADVDLVIEKANRWAATRALVTSLAG